MFEGARRVGKTTIAEEFARNEYESYIPVDFSNTAKEICYNFDEIPLFHGQLKLTQFIQMCANELVDIWYNSFIIEI